MSDSAVVTDDDCRFEGWTEEQFKEYEDSLKAALYSPVQLHKSEDIQDDSKNKDNTQTKEAQPKSSNVPTTATVNTDCLVGEIPIHSGETDTGAKTYEIPVEAHPGMNGFAPKIALAYNSHKGNSTLGQGWYISGLSEISRCDKTVYYDGKTQSIQMNEGDSFTLDGMRLIRTSPYGSVVSYESEQGKIKVKAYVSNNVVSHFEVFYPNGHKGVYGSSYNTTNQLTYPIASMTDMNGNKIEYYYESSAYNHRISFISYNGASINFSYQTRLDPLVSYRAGCKITENKCVQKIECKCGYNVFRTYTMGYTTMTTSPYCTLLTSVGCTASGEQLNPITFYYGSGNTALSYSTANSHLLYWYSSNTPGRIRTCVGKIDPWSSASPGVKSDALLAYPNNNPYWHHHEGGSLFSHSVNRFDNLFSPNDTIVIAGNLNDNIAMPLPIITAGAGFIEVLFADIEGAQGESLVKVNNNVVGSNDRVTFSVYKPNAVTGLSHAYTRTFDFSTVYTDYSDYKSIQPKYYYAGDFNGDGRQEILAVSCHQPFGDTSKPSMCYLFDLENNAILFQGHVFDYNVEFVGTQQTNAIAAYNNTDKLVVLDYDGDGKTDVCLVNDNGLTVYTFETSGSTLVARTVATSGILFKSQLANRSLLLGELNGDGLMDLVVTSATTGGIDWKVLHSYGDGRFDLNTMNVTANGSDDSFFLIDVNGDNKTDLIKYSPNGFSTFLTRNNTLGTTSFTTSFPASSPTLMPINLNSPNSFSTVISVKNGIATRYSFSKDDALEVLATGMVSSLGVVETNEYHHANEEGIQHGIYNRGYGADFPYINLCEKVPLIANSSLYLNGSRIKNDSFNYGNAVYHRQGMGFCGFETVSKKNIRNQYTIKTFLPYSHGVLKSESHPEGINNYTYSINVASNRTKKILLTEQSTSNYLTGVETSTAISYDTNGMPTTETTTYSDGTIVTKQSSYSNNVTVGDGYYIGYLTNHIITTTKGNSSCSERTYISSFANCQPLTKSTYINGYKTAQYVYTYDSRGNTLTETQTKFNSSNSATSSCTYDFYGRVTSRTNHLGETETFDYNNMWKVSCHTDERGNATTFSYDAFGKQIGFVDSDNVTESTTYAWDAQGTNGLYSITKQGMAVPTTKTVYDAFGREVRITDLRFNGAERKIDKRYDVYGNLIKESMPFTSSAATSWTTYTYDNYGRILSCETPTGNTTSYSYTSGENEVTIESNGATTTKRYDAQGNMLSVTDGAGTVTFNLDADGQPASVTAPGNVTTTFGYDRYRRRTSMSDPSLGLTSYTYDADGNMASETTANGETIYYAYDNYGRLTTKTAPEFTTTYSYNSHGDLTSATSTNGTSQEFSYNSKGNLSSEKYCAVDGKWIQKSHSYGSGLLRTTTYASQLGLIGTLSYTYANNVLSEIKMGNSTVFSLTSENGMGLPTQVATGAITRQYTYNADGNILQRKAFSASRTYQNILLAYNNSTKNVTSRKDATRNKIESFGYDGQNRLVSMGSNSVSYDIKGNITSKSGVGTFAYNHATKPYAITDVSLAASSMLPTTQQDIEYASFYRPVSIEEGSYKATFVYGPDFNRVKTQVATTNNMSVRSCYYLGNDYELDLSPNWQYERLYLGGDYYGACAVYVKDLQQNTSSIYYILRDHLGSITHVVAADGTLKQELSYDAWGALRNPSTHATYSISQQPTLFLGRGYTGHEHLTQFGLINMNARLYDPAVGRFLSPDPNVQSPDASQNYNRYSYCLNNPLCNVDKDGESIFHLFFNALTDLAYNICKNGFNVNQYNWNRTINSWKIDKGMFKGSFEQVFMKLTWGSFPSLVGNELANLLNSCNMIDNVTDMDGMLALSGITHGHGAFTIGPYSFGPKNYQATWKDNLFVHEYGHYIQSLRFGPLYFPVIAIPSLCSAAFTSKWQGMNHGERWFEINASNIGTNHFKNKYGGPDDGNHFNIDVFRDKSIIGKYKNPRTDGGKQDTDEPEHKYKIVIWDFIL